MIDTHAHLNFDEYKENFDAVLGGIKAAGVKKVIIPAVEPSKFDEIAALASKYDMIYAAIGVHPSECAAYNEETEKKIYGLCRHPKVVAIGEIGPDYHYDAENQADKTLQRLVFKKQLDIAQNIELPVLIHDREAHNDVFNILQDFQLKNTVFHCFSGTPEFAEKCLSKGYYIAIGGIVTFKKADDLKETARIVPLDRLLLETDAPYLAPAPFRGKVNTPAYLKYTAQAIADIKGIDVQDVIKASSDNAEKLFGI